MTQNYTGYTHTQNLELTGDLYVGDDVTIIGDCNITGTLSAGTTVMGEFTMPTDEKIGFRALTNYINSPATGQMAIVAPTIGVTGATAVNIDGGTLSLDSTDTANLTMTANSASAKTMTIQATNSGAGTAALDINVDEAITIDSAAAGVSIDGATASNLSCAAGDLTLEATTGSVNVNANEAAADQIKLAATGTIAGNAINAVTTDGGIAITAGGAVNGDITLTAEDDLIENIAGHKDVNVTGTYALDAAGISLDSTVASNFTVTGATVDLTLASVGGSVELNGSEEVADAVVIRASGTAGGIDVDAGSAGIAVDTTGSISLDAAGASNLTTSTGALTVTSAAAATWSTTAGNLAIVGAGGTDITATAGNLDILSAAGSTTITSTGATSDLTLTVGQNYANTVTGTYTDTVTGAYLIDGTSTIILDSAAASAGAIELHASDAAGGLDFNAGTGGIDVDTTGDYTLDAVGVSIDGTDTSNFTITANSADAETMTIAISNAGAGTGALVVSADDAITIDSTAAGFSIDGVTASNVTVTGASADLTLGATGGSINIAATESAADCINMDATGGIDIDSAGFTLDTTTMSIDSTDTTNVTMTANDAGTKTFTVAAVNAGAGDSVLALSADTITINGEEYGTSWTYFHDFDEYPAVLGSTIIANAFYATTGGGAAYLDSTLTNFGALVTTSTATTPEGVIYRGAIVADNDLEWTYETYCKFYTLTDTVFNVGMYVDANDYILFKFDSSLDAANIYLSTNNNGAGDVSTDTTIDIDETNWFKFKIEAFADDSFKVYINGSEVLASHGSHTIRDVAFKPYIYCLKTVSGNSTIATDYIAFKQTRA